MGASRSLAGIGFAAVAEPDFVRSIRASYDAVAADYAGWLSEELAARPLDRAMLAGFAELVLGIDLSPRMVETARASCLFSWRSHVLACRSALTGICSGPVRAGSSSS